MKAREYEVLTATTAHDLSNLLTVIVAGTTSLSDAAPNDAMCDEIRNVSLAATRGVALLHRLMCAARDLALELEPIALESLADGLRWTLRQALPPKHVVSVGVEPDLPRVMANAVAIEQMVLNLVTNARDAMPSGGVIRVMIRRARLDVAAAEDGTPIPAGEYVCVDVVDEGTGIDEVTRARMFEPFFTTKPASRGTGLGLASVAALARVHRAAIRVDSRLGRGTTITLLLPAYREVSERQA